MRRPALLAPALLALAALAGAAAPALAAPPSAADRAAAPDAGAVLNVLPPGSNGTTTVPQAAAFEAAQTRPANSVDQLEMYDALNRTGPGRITQAELTRYFKDGALGVDPADVVRTYSPRDGVTVLRDKAGVPHVYGTTYGDTAFGAGYVGTEDRMFLTDVLRHTGAARMAEFLGPSAANIAMDREQLRSAAYTPEEAAAQLAALPKRYGAEGAKLVAALDDFVAGINAAQDALCPLPTAPTCPVEYAALQQVPADYVPADVVYIASLVGGIFGRGGGGEDGNAEFLQKLTKQYGATNGRKVFDDFRERDDPEAPITVPARFPYDVPGTVDPKAVALPALGAPRASGTGDAPGGDAPALPLPAPTSVDGPLGAIDLSGLRAKDGMSNALRRQRGALRGRAPDRRLRPADRLLRPAAARRGRPQRPGHRRARRLLRGHPADRRARPRRRLRLVGDVVGQRQRRRRPGPAVQRRRHRAPRSRAPATSSAAPARRWTPTPTPSWPSPRPAAPGCRSGCSSRSCAPATASCSTGPRRPTGRPSPSSCSAPPTAASSTPPSGSRASTTPASSRTPRPSSGPSPASTTRSTGSTSTAATSRCSPPACCRCAPPASTRRCRATATRSTTGGATCPTPATRRRSTRRPATWSTGTTRPRPASRRRTTSTGYGSVYRSLSLDERVRSRLAGGRKMTRTGLVDAMQDAATVDLRAQQLLPELLAVVGDDPALREATTLLRTWLRNGSHREDRERDGAYTFQAAIALMDAWYPAMVKDVFRGAIGGLVDAVPAKVDDHPKLGLGSAWNGVGWYGYVDKDLRQVLGQKVSGRYARTYCGGGTLAGCRTALRASLAKAVAAELAAQSKTSVAQLTYDKHLDDIRATTAGVVGVPDIDWQNRPTFQQVVQFSRRR